MQAFFQWLAANPFILLFLTVGLAVWIGRQSIAGYGLGMVAAAIIVGCGLAVVASLCRQLGARSGEVGVIRAQAQADRSETLRMQQELDLQRNLLVALRAGDPYVVELLARDRFGYTRPGELSPPPLPAIDSAGEPRR